MFALLIELKRKVDHFVEHSGCDTTFAQLRLKGYIWGALFSVLLSISIGLKSVFTGSSNIASIWALFMVCMVLSLIALNIVKRLEIIYNVSNVVYISSVFSLVAVSETGQEQLLWCYAYPFLSVFILGCRAGTIWSLIFLGAIIIGITTIPEISSAYANDFIVQSSFTYLIILFIAYWYEKDRSRHINELATKDNALASEREHLAKETSLLNKEIEHRVELELELSKLASIDSITNVYNRQFFWLRTEQEVKRAQKKGIPVTVALVDIADFKYINKVFGYSAGEEILRNFASYCKRAVRLTDVVGRLGGEEFAIMLFDCDIRQSQELMVKIREEISKFDFTYNGQKLLFTIHFELIVINEVSQDNEHLDSSAEAMLYKAKRRGRNKIKLVYSGD